MACLQTQIGMPRDPMAHGHKREPTFLVRFCCPGFAQAWVRTYTFPPRLVCMPRLPSLMDSSCGIVWHHSRPCLPLLWTGEASICGQRRSTKLVDQEKACMCPHGSRGRLGKPMDERQGEGHHCPVSWRSESKLIRAGTPASTNQLKSYCPLRVSSSGAAKMLSDACEFLQADRKRS